MARKAPLRRTLMLYKWSPEQIPPPSPLTTHNKTCATIIEFGSSEARLPALSTIFLPVSFFSKDASSGLGRNLVQRTLEGSDKVIATARVLEQIQDLRTLADSSCLYLLQFDITDPSEVVSRKIDEALGVWGRIDVLVNDPETGLKMIESTRYLCSFCCKEYNLTVSEPLKEQMTPLVSFISISQDTCN
jgi:short chain dehydrogenase